MYNERDGKEPILAKDVEMKENENMKIITEKQNKNECINEVKKVQPLEIDIAGEPIIWLTRRMSAPSLPKHRFYQNSRR